LRSKRGKGVRKEAFLPLAKLLKKNRAGFGTHLRLSRPKLSDVIIVGFLAIIRKEIYRALPHRN
jgi:hypothetical protein